MYCYGLVNKLPPEDLVVRLGHFFLYCVIIMIGDSMKKRLLIIIPVLLLIVGIVSFIYPITLYIVIGIIIFISTILLQILLSRKIKKISVYSLIKEG